MLYVDMSSSKADIETLAFASCDNLYTINLSAAHGEVAPSAFWNAPCETLIYEDIGDYDNVCRIARIIMDKPAKIEVLPTIRRIRHEAEILVRGHP